MNSPEARYNATHADACMDTVERTLERLENALKLSDGVLVELVRLARLDARALKDRVHALRRRIEGSV